MNAQSDISYAQDICKGDKSAREKFILSISDKALYVSKKWNKSTLSNKDFYWTQEKGSVSKEDDIQNDWLWILEKLIKASCNYTGENKAQLMTYIFATLNSKFTFNDWLKKKYGDTKYIPNIIKGLSGNHQKLYMLLKRKTNENLMAEKLKLAHEEIQEMILEIKYILHKNNKSDFLNPKKIRLKISQDYNEDGLDQIEQIQDEDVNISSKLVEFEQFYSFVVEFYKNLPQRDRLLLTLYWGEGKNVSTLIDYISNEDQLGVFSNLSIAEDTDFYKYIDKICKDSVDWVKEKHPHFFSDYNITLSKMKKAFKVALKKF